MYCSDHDAGRMIVSMSGEELDGNSLYSLLDGLVAKLCPILGTP